MIYINEYVNKEFARIRKVTNNRHRKNIYCKTPLCKYIPVINTCTRANTSVKNISNKTQHYLSTVLRNYQKNNQLSKLLRPVILDNQRWRQNFVLDRNMSQGCCCITISSSNFILKSRENRQVFLTVSIITTNSFTSVK